MSQHLPSHLLLRLLCFHQNAQPAFFSCRVHCSVSITCLNIRIRLRLAQYVPHHLNKVADSDLLCHCFPGRKQVPRKQKHVLSSRRPAPNLKSFSLLAHHQQICLESVFQSESLYCIHYGTPHHKRSNLACIRVWPRPFLTIHRPDYCIV